MGIYAGDGDSYAKFFDAFNPIIIEYHGLEKDFEHKTDMDLSKIKGNVNQDAPIRSTW